jgi:hypothetical protein
VSVRRRISSRALDAPEFTRPAGEGIVVVGNGIARARGQLIAGCS